MFWIAFYIKPQSEVTYDLARFACLKSLSSSFDARETAHISKEANANEDEGISIAEDIKVSLITEV